MARGRMGIVNCTKKCSKKSWSLSSVAFLSHNQAKSESEQLKLMPSARLYAFPRIFPGSGTLQGRRVGEEFSDKGPLDQTGKLWFALAACRGRGSLPSL